jgi:hypothetical protein
MGFLIQNDWFMSLFFFFFKITFFWVYLYYTLNKNLIKNKKKYKIIVFGVCVCVVHIWFLADLCTHYGKMLIFLPIFLIFAKHDF